MHMQHEYAIPFGGGPVVVKYGGNAMPDPSLGGTDPTLSEIAGLWHAGWEIALVHGGGPEIDAALAQRGIVTERIDGMRITDAATLAVTEAVLCGTLNKRIVRALVALGVPAVGISGQDGSTLVAEAMRSTTGADLGFVGEIVQCDPRLLRRLLDARYLPVVSPLAISGDASTAFNVNADLAGGWIAGALGSRAFVQITNVPRVLRDISDPGSAIDELTPGEARAFSRSKACHSGMKPKLLAAAGAVTGGAGASYICGAAPGAIGAALFGDDATIVRSG
jgi:acetylglutamate kinase